MPFLFPAVRVASLGLAAIGACLLVVGCAATPVSTGPAYASPAPLPANLERGQYLAERECSRCHAITATGDSPAPMAPTFRALASDVGGPALESRLLRVSELGHYEMPRAGLERSDIRDLATYIESLD